MSTSTAVLEAQANAATLAPDRYARRSVLVFRTSVNTKGQVLFLSPALNELLGAARWSFDLEDRDRVFRIEHDASIQSEVIDLLRRAGFMCAELD